MREIREIAIVEFTNFFNSRIKCKFERSYRSIYQQRLERFYFQGRPQLSCKKDC